MTNDSADDQHSSTDNQQQDQSSADAPQDAEGPTPKAVAAHYLKVAFDTAKRFVVRQKVPAFLLFYRDHWRELLQHVRDGLSQPTDNELWIRGRDPSPGVFREEHAWDIDAAHYCVICGRLTDEPRRRVRNVVRDFDGMVYGLLVTVVVMIVVRIATASYIAAVASLFMGLWCARRLIVEEKVRMDCSTCAEHTGREATLPLRLKRDTLIVELGGRKARTVFLRKLRDVSTSTGWENPAPATDRDQSGFPTPVPPVPGGPDADRDSAAIDSSTPPLTDVPVNSSGAGLPVEAAPVRIPLAESDDSSPVEFRTFEVHDSDGVSVDAPLTSERESHSEPNSPYFKAGQIDGAGSIDQSPTDADGTLQEPTDEERSTPAVGNVLFPDSENETETIPLAARPETAAEPDRRWFLQIDGIEIGPVPLEQVHQLKAAGTLKRADLVRREGEADWSGSDSITAQEASTLPKSDDGKPQNPVADPWSKPIDGSDAPWDPWAD